MKDMFNTNTRFDTLQGSDGAPGPTGQPGSPGIKVGKIVKYFAPDRVVDNSGPDHC